MHAAPTGTTEELLAACAARQPVRLTCLQQADAACLDWHAVPATVGSFADQQSTLQVSLQRLLHEPSV